MPYSKNKYGVKIEVGANPDYYEVCCVLKMIKYFRSNIIFLASGDTSMPDMLVERLNQYWEIKDIKGNGKNTVHNILHGIHRQSENVILTLFRSNMKTQVAIGRIKTELKKATYIKRIILITKSNKIIAIK